MVIERILTDPDVQEDYQELMEMTNMLRMIKLRPRRNVVDNILAYSEKVNRD